ncbi:MAG TPA: hypothetical protein VNI57_07345, partial [Candidatus Saccharimonadales bacterium]|nr:hypothetical protein [Candidatus Saccharimonadales bacterium]
SRTGAGPSAPSRSASAAGAPSSFVCEADVRDALREERKIRISSKSIVTPAARELGDSHRIFIEV